MGLLDKLFGQSASKKNSEASDVQKDLTPCKTEQALLERYGGIAFERQLDFGEVIGSNSWNVDMNQGTIAFGSNLVFSLQALGTFSHGSQTWLWAWANKKSGLSESVIQQALHLKKYGEDNGIDLLRNDTFDFSKDDLHLIGLIASGMFNASAYYIADYGQGAMLLTVKSDKIDQAKKENHHRMLTVFPQLISQFEMNHKLALTNYLKAKRYSVTDHNNSVTGSKNGDVITAEFDPNSRLINLKG